jgi:ATP-dependent DNA helicase RecG
VIDLVRLDELIAQGEAVELEFKSDRRTISDREIYEDVVAMANASGGMLLIGVEDDGQITGARPRHGTHTDPTRLQAAIFNNTAPPINTRISVVPTPQGDVIALEVNRYPDVCATKAGVCLRRVLGARGPECVPFYPYEHLSRRSTLGLADFSACPCEGASLDDLNPLEFERLRQTITRLRGDATLLELNDTELAKALQLVETVGGEFIPNFAGLLLLGRDEPLRNMLPTHEAAFQVLDRTADVRVNDFFRCPLLRTIEELQSRFDARVEEQEVIVGAFRLPVPEYGRVALREAMLNALLHRDYAQMGTVFIQWHPDHLLITNPGGLPDGVTLGNLLVHEPKPRNPRLYEAAKRIGLVEKTGRGIDKIFHDQLRLGRRAPDYGRSDATAVRVVLLGGEASLEFAAFVCEQDKQGTPLALEEMLILNALGCDGPNRLGGRREADPERAIGGPTRPGRTRRPWAPRSQGSKEGARLSHELLASSTRGPAGRPFPHARHPGHSP